ncbi:hypothetical protein EDD15DRAFT_2195807 [Pisolithus albus]|nr:hypothetical protein EDD15DRAFT_2195807 [Pisolithus albus]
MSSGQRNRFESTNVIFGRLQAYQKVAGHQTQPGRANAPNVWLRDHKTKLKDVENSKGERKRKAYLQKDVSLGNSSIGPKPIESSQGAKPPRPSARTLQTDAVEQRFSPISSTSKPTVRIMQERLRLGAFGDGLSVDPVVDHSDECEDRSLIVQSCRFVSTLLKGLSWSRLPSRILLSYRMQDVIVVTISGRLDYCATWVVLGGGLHAHPPTFSEAEAMMLFSPVLLLHLVHTHYPHVKRTFAFEGGLGVDPMVGRADDREDSSLVFQSREQSLTSLKGLAQGAMLGTRSDVSQSTFPLLALPYALFVHASPWYCMQTGTVTIMLVLQEQSHVTARILCIVSRDHVIYPAFPPISRPTMVGQATPHTGSDISATNLSALISLITNLELNAADAETLANILFLRSRCEDSQPMHPGAASYPSSTAASRFPSHEEYPPAVSPHPSTPALPVSIHLTPDDSSHPSSPVLPVSICLTPDDSSDPVTILIRGNVEYEARVPSLADDCVYTPTAVFFTMSM